MEQVENMPEGSKSKSIRELSKEELQNLALKEVIEERKQQFIKSHPKATESQIEAIEKNFRRIAGLDVQKIENQVNTLYTENYESGADDMRKEVADLAQELLHSKTSDERKKEINSKIDQLEKDIENNELAAKDRRGMVKP